MTFVCATYLFGAGQAGNQYLRTGWAAPEAGFVWSAGRESVLMLPPVDGAGDLVLELSIDPFCHPPALPHQTMSISVNGVEIADRRFGGQHMWRLALPRSATSGQLHVELTCSRATSPRALLGAPDDRILGFRLSRIVVLRRLFAPPPVPAARMRDFWFGWSETTEDLLQAGWGAPENGYVWALGRTSQLRVPLAGDGAPVTAVLDMRPYVEEPALWRQRLAVGQDGRLLGFVDLRRHSAIAFLLQVQPGQEHALLQFDHIDAAADIASVRHRSGQPFAFALQSLRLFPTPPPHQAESLPPIAGQLADGSFAARVQALSGQSLREISAQFEGLGNGCGMGFLQQQIGDDRPGLFRFAAVWQPRLVEALLNGFAGLGRTDALYFGHRNDTDPNWRIIDEVYGFTFPSPYPRGVAPPAGALVRAGRMLARLGEYVVQAAAEGGRNFAMRLDEDAGLPAALAVQAALSARGDGTLLCLQDGVPGQRGTVERWGHRLLRGYALAVDGAAEERASVLVNAWLLDRAERGREKEGVLF